MSSEKTTLIWRKSSSTWYKILVQRKQEPKLKKYTYMLEKKINKLKDHNNNIQNEK
jgi:hypothetical protein